MFQAEKEEGIESKLRHPSTDRHYFAEYPFQNGGGVKFFQKRFSFENYYIPEGVADPQLEQYLSYLVAFARQNNHRPFAKFCRFALRTQWLKRTLPSVSCYVVRAPETMFRSYWSLGGRDSYFLSGLVLILSKNRECPLFREFVESISLPYIEAPTVQDEITAAHRFSQSLDVQALRDIFLLLWVLTLEHNLAFGDFVLDVDLLAIDPSYREFMASMMADSLGVSMSFDDVQQPRSQEAPGTVVSPARLEVIGRAARQIPVSYDLAMGRRIGPESESVLEQVLARV